MLNKFSYEYTHLDTDGYSKTNLFLVSVWLIESYFFFLNNFQKSELFSDVW